MQYYTLKLCGLTRELPLMHVGKTTRLASFTMLGDVELVDALADILAGKLRGSGADYLVCPHVKVVPLVHGVAKRLGHARFVVCRKSVKAYMVDPTIVKPLSHFPKHTKPVVINGRDRDFIAGKRVVIIDDVVSTGVTMRMMKKLMQQIGATVVRCVAVLKQGDKQFDPIDDLIYLAQLPVFKEIDTV